MLLKNNDTILRILDAHHDKLLVIDCVKLTMPVWINASEVADNSNMTEEEFCHYMEVELTPLTDMDPSSAATAQHRYAMIVPILEVLGDIKKRCDVINNIADAMKISKQTVRKYLCLYLAYQDRSVLAPKKKIEEKTLSEDEKNMRWALNKYFYTSSKNSLNVAYCYMLQERYCDKTGELFDTYPSFYQFRYFYRKTKNLQNFYISRDGKRHYERNNRPLLGDGVQQFAGSVGTGLLDSTICDIYLVNEEGELVGRPILLACIDAFSGLCNGYYLSWQGGIYSLRGLMLNIIEDKVAHCEKFGITITRDQWDSTSLPSRFVTDMGSEYISDTFAQISELGVTVENLPPYRPDLKGPVEKFFDLIQNSYKPYLKGKGVIEPDFRERGAHDYRKDACLTMDIFEKIILKAIVVYNSKRTISNYPFTEAMIKGGVEAISSSVWEWGKKINDNSLINTTPEELIRVLLPRTAGKFTRKGLIVNKLRYKNHKYMNKYLEGNEVTVAYDPDSVSCVWLIENGVYIQFDLIESRFDGDSLDEAMRLKEECRRIVNENEKEELQAKVDLGNFIKTLTDTISKPVSDTKNIRQTRQKEVSRSHIKYSDVIGGDDNNE